MKRLIGIATTTALSAGLLLAQGPGFGWGAGQQGNPPADPEVRQERRLNFLGAALELTETQKQQAKVIFDGACQSAQAIQPLLQQAQQTLRDAAKANASASEIETLAAEVGKLMAQMRAIHANAFANFYQILTPVQREKLEAIQGAGMGAGLGHGFGGRGGPRWQ